MAIFTGTGVALVTPLDKDRILYEETEKLISLVVSGGADALVALGSTGEAATLTAAQKEDFVRFVRSKTSLPLIVGVGGSDTSVVAENCLAAKKWGADALLIVTPFYNKCTQNGAYLHYKYISERTDLPIIVYNVPSRTGFNLLPKTMARINGLKNIAAIKEASGSMAQIAECLRLGVDVLCGDDALTAPAMCLGASGVISVAANIAPSLVSRMTDMALSGNLASAGAIQLRLLPLIDALFSEVNPIPVRAALSLLKINCGTPRLPMTEIGEENKAKLITAMEEIGLI